MGLEIELNSQITVDDILGPAAALNVSDLFVLRQMDNAERFLHVGGLGRGEGWAGIVDLYLEDCAEAQKAYQENAPVHIRHPEIQSIFGPYFSRSAVFLPVNHEVLVIVGTGNENQKIPEKNTELLALASNAAKILHHVSPAKGLADELEVLHAVKEMLASKPRTTIDALNVVADCAVRSLSCELSVVKLINDDRVAIAEHGWELVGSAADAGAILSALAVQNTLPHCIQNEVMSPLPHPLSHEDGIRSYLILPIGRIGVLFVSHTAKIERGFTNLCRKLGNHLAEAAEMVLMNAMRNDERRENEKTLQSSTDAANAANHAKSEFLASLSHELRTPMNAILGFGQMLEYHPTDKLSENQQDCVDQIKKGGQHMLKLIEEVLDLSKIEAGKISLSVETMCITDILEECCQMIAPLAKKRGIKTIVKNDLVAGHSLRADPVRLKQVLLNLMSNAVKYNRDNGTLKIECREQPEGGIYISVTDTGKGIPKELHNALFAPFDRLGAETSDIEGTGIGLAIAKQVVELMDGTIGVESEVGKGATFWIKLPLS
jgi:signal transduction histidine kinase